MMECKFPLRVVKTGNDEPSSLLDSRRDSRQLPEALMLAANEYKIWDTEESWSPQSPSGLLLNTLSPCGSTPCIWSWKSMWKMRNSNF